MLLTIIARTKGNLMNKIARGSLFGLCLSISSLGFADGWSGPQTITDVQFSTSSNHMTITFTPGLATPLLPNGAAGSDKCDTVGNTTIEQPGDYAKAIVLAAMMASKPIEMYITNKCVYGRPTSSVIRLRK